MKFTMEETNTDFEFLTLPDDTIVQLVVEQIELRPVPGKNGNPGWEKLSFKFKLLELPTKLEDEYAAIIGTTIWGSVSARFTEHPDNKLRKWAEALLDIGELEPGFELDTEMLIGRKARGVVSTYPKKDGGRNHQIAGLLPLQAQPALVGSFTIDEEPPF